MNVHDPLVPYKFLLGCLGDYLPEAGDPMQPLVSPLLTSSEILARFPPTFVCGAGYDPLLDDYAPLVQRLKSLGVPCEFRIFFGLPHGFLNMRHVIKEVSSAIRLGSEWFKQILEARQ